MPRLWTNSFSQLPSPQVLRGRRAGDEGLNCGADLSAYMEIRCPDRDKVSGNNTETVPDALKQPQKPGHNPVSLVLLGHRQCQSRIKPLKPPTPSISPPP